MSGPKTRGWSVARRQTQSRLKPRNSRITLILTCEHGGAKIPKAFQKHFKNAASVLKTHRGLDIGALEIARDLARMTGAALDYATVSRLVVDLNRSTYSETLLSEFTSTLNEQEKARLLDTYYHPFRNRVTERIRAEISSGCKVIHLSVHSFTPIWNDERRQVDLSILYDPRSRDERKFSDCWMSSLKSRFPDLRLRRNNPYKGSADGFSRWLKRNLPENRYVPIMIEMNQGLVGEFASLQERRKFSAPLSDSLNEAVHNFSTKQER